MSEPVVGGRWSRVRSSGARIVNFAVQRGVSAHVALVQPPTRDVALWRRIEGFRRAIPCSSSSPVHPG